MRWSITAVAPLVAAAASPAAAAAACVTAAVQYADGSIGRVPQHLRQQVVASTPEPDATQALARPASAHEPALVETRATVRAFSKEDGGKRLYVHLKVVPRANLPFTTLRFRVRDSALLSGLREGASVKFRAERAGGENTLVSIRAVPPCVRFQPCD